MFHKLLPSGPLYYFSVAAFSLFIVLVVIPSIIHVANKLSLFDDVNVDRKSHSYGISRLGGVAIFCSFTITTLLFLGLNENGYQHSVFLLTSCIMLLAVGLKDDLTGVNANTKFLIQLVVALIMVFLGNVRLTNMYSVFNIYELPYWVSVSGSVLIIMFLINAFNLIDGIDGLLGITAVIVNLTFGFMFAHMNQPAYACMAFAMVGALAGFLRYNFTPAKIFMGDTGSLIIGLVSAVLSLKFIELNKTDGSQVVYYNAAPSVAVAVLIGPVFDAIRVFVLRIIKKGSPFTADNNHIHHRVLKLGLNHLQTTFILMVFNVIIIFLALELRPLGNFVLIGMLFILCILFNMILSYLIRSKERNSYKISNLLR